MKQWKKPEDLIVTPNDNWTVKKLQYFCDYNKIDRMILNVYSDKMGKFHTTTYCDYFCNVCRTEQKHIRVSTITFHNSNCKTCFYLSKKGKKLIQKKPEFTNTIEEAQELVEKVKPNSWLVLSFTELSKSKSKSKGKSKGKRIQCKCKICGEVSTKYLKAIRRTASLGCRFCKSLTGEEIINRSIEIHGDIFEFPDLILNKKYTIAEPFTIICKNKKHSSKKNYNLLLNRKRGCKLCNNSKGEKYIEELLNEFGIEFVKEKILSETKFFNKEPNRFDFYLPKFNLLLEIDGGFHRYDVEGFSNLQEQQAVDEFKNNLAEEFGFNLERIIYNDNKLEKIWKKELKKSLIKILLSYSEGLNII